MDHPSEHSIELYVLRAPDGESGREEIEAHLKECAGCRTLVDAASSFYAELQVEILNRPAGNPSPFRSLAITSRRSPAIFESPFREARLSQGFSGGRMRRFVRAHPFIAGGGGVVLAGGIVMLILTFLRPPARDLNPTRVIENKYQNTLDAYNRADEKLWSLPVPHLGTYADQEVTTGARYLQLADLDGDGMNEIITSLPVDPGEVEEGSVLHVLNYRKTDLLKIRPGEAVVCRDRFYPDEFHIRGFSVGDFSGSGHMEILVLSNDLHSPSIVSRYDAGGKRLGTFRHFGQLRLMDTNPLMDGARKEFVFFGASDRDEGKFTAILLGLDPSLIVGDGESSFSGGFGLPHSAAERYYVHIPPTEVAKGFGLNVFFLGAKAVPLQDEPGFRVVAGGIPDSSIYFEYIFRANFSIVEVKSENKTKHLFDRLAAKGLVTGGFFDDYMKVVAGEVRYWDGHRWQLRPTPVSN